MEVVSDHLYIAVKRAKVKAFETRIISPGRISVKDDGKDILESKN